MTRGDVEFVQVCCQMVVVPFALWAGVRADAARLDDARRARGWSDVTRDSVVFATWQFGVLFGCPALVVWFVKTRGWGPGALFGLASAAALLVLAVAAALLPELAIERLGL